MWSAGSSQLNAATEKFKDSSIVTDILGTANDSSQSSNIKFSLSTVRVQPVSFNFWTCFLRSSSEE